MSISKMALMLAFGTALCGCDTLKLDLSELMRARNDQIGKATLEVYRIVHDLDQNQIRQIRSVISANPNSKLNSITKKGTISCTFVVPVCKREMLSKCKATVARVVIDDDRVYFEAGRTLEKVNAELRRISPDCELRFDQDFNVVINKRDSEMPFEEIIWKSEESESDMTIKIPSVYTSLTKRIFIAKFK